MNVDLRHFPVCYHNHQYKKVGFEMTSVQYLQLLASFEKVSHKQKLGTACFSGYINYKRLVQDAADYGLFMILMARDG
jgi:hypothetical protein